MADSLWLPFGLAALGVITAGILIGYVSAEIGDRFRLGRAWAGAVLVSFATTLPELGATLTVVLHGKVGLALGAILGSIVFNLCILVWVDLFEPQSFYRRVSRSHLTTGLLGLALLGTLIVGLALTGAGPDGSDGARIGHVGLISVCLVGLYGFGQYALFQTARKRFGEEERPPETPLHRFPLARVLLAYLVLAAVILVSAYHLGVSAEGLADRYGLGATFAGATLLGIVTSLPEITNGLFCAKRREYDLAVGNVLGANAFVFLVLVVADVCYVRGPLLRGMTGADISASMIMASLALVMQGVVLGAIAIRHTARIWRLSVASIILIILYAASLAITYRVTGA